VILVDVNVLVEAAHRDAARHAQSATWLREALAAPPGVGLADLAVTGAVRVLTSPRVFADPVPPAEAAAFVSALRGAAGAVDVPATRATWSTFARLLRDDPGVRGNLVPDAWLAALALSHGAALATRDRGLDRFAGPSLVEPGRP
jgi:uncharacterized protein